MSSINDINSVIYNTPNIQKKNSSKNNAKNKNIGQTTFERIFSVNPNKTEDIESNDKTENIITKDLENIEFLLQDIGIAGELLKKEQTLENFDSYKKLVKSYIDKILDISIEIKRVSTFKRIKNSINREEVVKIHTRVLDKEMIDLTKLFFEGQKSVMAIVNKIDRIQGILVDLKF